MKNKLSYEVLKSKYNGNNDLMEAYLEGYDNGYKVASVQMTKIMTDSFARLMQQKRKVKK